RVLVELAALAALVAGEEDEAGRVEPLQEHHSGGRCAGACRRREHDRLPVPRLPRTRVPRAKLRDGIRIEVAATELGHGRQAYGKGTLGRPPTPRCGPRWRARSGRAPARGRRPVGTSRRGRLRVESVAAPCRASGQASALPIAAITRSGWKGFT